MQTQKLADHDHRAEEIGERDYEGQQKIEEVQTRSAPANGVLPEGFYVTTNKETLVRYQNKWLKPELAEMDCAIKIENGEAELVAITEVQTGDEIVVGSRGVKTISQEEKVKKKERESEDDFDFMSSEVSAERSKGEQIASIAEALKSIREQDGNITVVGGPAIVHTGAQKYLAEMIRGGYVTSLLTGNALAVHDIESAIFGTALDSCVKERSEDGDSCEGQRGMHMRAINKIRAAGSIEEAVEKGVLDEGVMYEAVRNDVEYILAGSIRDDGPLPDTITDTMEAQQEMRRIAQNSDFVLMLATMLHSIATGNVMPARVQSVCVDINTDAVTKLADRGSAQATGMVTDVELFLNALTDELFSRS
ncbi:TIGR00300 family protein [Halarsenatibacter silvermanii]|uniref:TIGR00300 family protein n=1 Tax=Halarsenatibacter silvermanii TaxID=321763 RepID=A0A1G9R017_9FIRM|nr:TIGR00300 family protein [Halarsenatibacter silvermanii]SDM16598.1 TIGR00300 family protein [Halarsenatibacter silvermanii]